MGRGAAPFGGDPVTAPFLPSAPAYRPAPLMETNLRAARLAVSLCFILNGGLFACWVSRIPAVQESLGLNHARLGIALFAASLAALVSMPFTGWCITRYGSRSATRVAALLYCLALPLMGLATNLWSLAAGLLVYGGFYGAFDVAMNAQAVAVEERIGRPIMSTFHALYSAGGLVGAALGGQIAGLGVTPLAHFVGGAILLGGLTLAIAWPR